MTETLIGGCFCGAVRYRAEAGETLHYLCHCRDCQRYSGGSYHAAIVVAASTLDVSGNARVHVSRADSGRMIARHFCGDCGGHLFTSPWPEATRFSVKAGTLDDPSLFEPACQIWCRSRQDRFSLRELESFEQGLTRPLGIGTSTEEPDQDKF